MPPCAACALVRGEQTPEGGVLLRTAHFLVHGIAAPSPIAGWMVVSSLRHTRSVDTLEADELAELGPLLARVMRAQKSELDAEHVYVLALGDVLHHCHVHLVPRYAQTPPELRGRGAFDARADQMLPSLVMAEAGRRLARAFGDI